MIRLFLLLVLFGAFLIIWLCLRRSPTFTVACETLTDDKTAEAVAELKSAERDVDREIKLTKKRIKKDASMAEILADARKKPNDTASILAAARKPKDTK